MFQNRYILFFNSLPKIFRKKFFYILFCMVLSSSLEVLTFITIKPIVSSLVNVKRFSLENKIDNTFLSLFISDLNLNELLLISIILSTSTIIIRYLTLKNISKYSQLVGIYLADRTLNSILINSDEDINKQFQSTDSIATLTSLHIDYASSSITAQLQLIYAIISFFILGIGIICVEPLITSFAILGLFTFFILSSILTRPIIKKNGLIIKETSRKCIKEALTLYQIRDQLRIYKDFSSTSKNFNSYSFKQRMSQHIIFLCSATPRIILDYLIFILIPISVFIYWQLYSLVFYSL